MRLVYTRQCCARDSCLSCVPGACSRAVGGSRLQGWSCVRLIVAWGAAHALQVRCAPCACAAAQLARTGTQRAPGRRRIWRPGTRSDRPRLYIRGGRQLCHRCPPVSQLGTGSYVHRFLAERFAVPAVEPAWRSMEQEACRRVCMGAIAWPGLGGCFQADLGAYHPTYCPTPPESGARAVHLAQGVVVSVLIQCGKGPLPPASQWDVWVDLARRGRQQQAAQLPAARHSATATFARQSPPVTSQRTKDAAHRPPRRRAGLLQQVRCVWSGARS